MARPGVTYQDVATAAIEIQAQGNYPTIENVRASLGTGSSSTIGPHLRNWRMQQNTTDQAAAKENLPAELISLIKGLWERINHLADERVSAVEANSEQIIQQFRRETEDLQLANQKWQAQHDHLLQEKQLLSVELNHTQQTLVALKEEYATLVVVRDGLAKQIEEKQVRIEELHRLHQQVQTNLEHYREAAREQRLLDQRKYEQREQQLEKSLHDLQLVLKKSEQNIIVLEQQQTNLTNDKLLLQENNAELMHQLETTKNHLLDIEKKHTHSTHVLQQVQDQYQIEQKKSAEHMQQISQFQTQLALSAQELSYANKALADASQQQAALAHEKWYLMQEKSQLEGQLKQLNQIISRSGKN